MFIQDGNDRLGRGAGRFQVSGSLRAAYDFGCRAGSFVHQRQPGGEGRNFNPGRVPV